jgi:hypothetical protein
VPAHCHGETTSPGSTIIPYVFSKLAPSITAKSPSGMLVNHLAWKDKFIMNSAITVKTDEQHVLEVRLGLPGFLWMWRGWAFPLRGLLFVFWVITGNPCSIIHSDPQDDIYVTSGFTLFLAHKHTAASAYQ